MRLFNGEELTFDSIKKSREHFADVCQTSIDEVKKGEVRVNAPELYFEFQQMCAKQFLAGEWDHTFTSRQHAYFIQTGKSIPLLP